MTGAARPRDIRLPYQTRGGRPPTPPPGHASARTAEKPLDPGALLPRFGPFKAGAPAPTRAARPLEIAAPPAEHPAHAAGPEGTEVKVGPKTSASALGVPIAA